MTLARHPFFAALLVLACVGPATAHVTVRPKTVAAGAMATLTFRCPNERAPATTTQLIVQMPEGRPFAQVDVMPIPGWHTTITRRTLAQPIAGRHGSVTNVVDTIAWTGIIRGTAAQRFTIRAGPMPRAAGTLAFKTLQRYSDGTVVRWIELRNPGEPEPALPAPLIKVR